MPQPTPRRWQSWRIQLTAAPARAANTPDALALRMTPPPPHRPLPAPVTDVPAHLHAEAPDADGIRQGLVAHVRRLIAEGVYDSPDRWALAEERLFDAVAGR